MSDSEIAHTNLCSYLCTFLCLSGSLGVTEMSRSDSVGLGALGAFSPMLPRSSPPLTEGGRGGRERGRERRGRRREGGRVWVSFNWAPGWLHLSSTYTDQSLSPWPCPSWWSSCSSIAPPSRLPLLRDGKGWEGGKLWEHYYGNSCIEGKFLKFPPCIYKSLCHWLIWKQLWILDLQQPHNTLLLHHHILTASHPHSITVIHYHLHKALQLQ